jgi:hypothetical protein
MKYLLIVIAMWILIAMPVQADQSNFKETEYVYRLIR